VSKRQN